jgi:hypothetical protein
VDEDHIIARARRVRRLLTETDVQAAFDDVAQGCLNEIRNTAWDDVRRRECCHAEIRALDRLRATLQGWADELIHRNID